MHKRNNTKPQNKQYKAQSIQVHILPKYPHIHTPTHYKTHTHAHTLNNKLKQPQYKRRPNEIVTIQSSTLSIRSP